ncbi:hypothetical protein GW17_00037581 [Ensete ventricosum]|nr:hypothetical protein GW17_00037581 [Ensete ventricosum]
MTYCPCLFIFLRSPFTGGPPAKSLLRGLGRMHLMGIPPSQYLLYRMQATPPHGNVGWGEPHRAIARGLSLIPLDSCVSCFGAMTVGSMEKTIVGKKAHAYC